MKYELAIVRPGGGETNYAVTINNATHIPCVGEYINLLETDVRGVQAFRVLYVTSDAIFIHDGQYQEESVVVQAEPIHHHDESEAHTENLKGYTDLAQYPVSGY